MLCVPTPQADNGRADMSYVQAVATEIGLGGSAQAGGRAPSRATAMTHGSSLRLRQA
jgi:hypothetical protein